MKNKLTTPRRVVFFYGTPPGDERFTYPNFPTWAVDNAYGFPSIEGKGFKVVPTFEGDMVDPDTQEHTLTAEELRKGREFVAKWFPALANEPLVERKVCQREDSVDEHFIVNQHPELTTCGWSAAGRATATNTASCLASTWRTESWATTRSLNSPPCSS